jgi:hypothetical protein
MSAMAEKGEGFYVEKKSGDRAHDEETALIEAALARADEETKIGIKAIFRLYWRGAMWSMLLSLALVMEGMDVGLVNNFFGQQAYIERFGHVDAAGKKFIPANWQAAINNGQQIGAVAGLLFNGWAQSKYGSKKVYMLAMVLLAAFGECSFLLEYQKLMTSLHPCLRYLLTHALRRKHDLWFSMGYFPDLDHGVRCRNLSHGHARLPHLLGINVLGYRFFPRCWCFTSFPRSSRKLG